MSDNIRIWICYAPEAPKWTPRNAATHAPLCNTLPSKDSENPGLNGKEKTVFILI